MVGRVTRWAPVGVISAPQRTGRSGEVETTYRCWLLEPGGQERRVDLGPFKVLGRFTEVERKNGRAANEAWKALERDPAG